MIFWRKKLGFSLLVISSIILLDQALKYPFTSSCNSGIAFGLLQNQRTVNTLISATVVFICFYFLMKEKRRFISFALLLVIGGGASNLFDRVTFGCVRDFIDFKIWPSFNLADSLISVGVIIIAVEIAFKRGQFNDLNQ